ncbi:MAG: DUF1178 family protein [Sphingomonadales bacterium]|nr:DUF1178 family protein [Sphingomonadales bacterium]
MIVFDLKCENGHVFEAWFRTSATYDTQKADGVVVCPQCGSGMVEKALMAPNVAAKANQMSDTKSAHFPTDELAPAVVDASVEMFGEAVDKLRKHVEENCDYVGGDFTEEARAMHYGEKEARAIYGETTEDEREELADEGIDVLSLSMMKTSRRTEN